jgi:hypothetical protein
MPASDRTHSTVSAAGSAKIGCSVQLNYFFYPYSDGVTGLFVISVKLAFWQLLLMLACVCARQ